MVVQIMVQHDLCTDCDQNRRCRDVYAKLGASRGPSITCKVLVAFLVPLLLFILALFVLQKVLAGLGMTDGLNTLCSLAGAALLVLAYAAGALALGKRLRRSS